MNTNTTPKTIEINKTLEQAKSDSQTSILFEKKFTWLWQEIIHSLEKLLEDLRKKRHDVDTEFKKQIEVVLHVCRTDTGIPSILELEKCLEIENSYEIVYEKYLNQVRAHVLQNLSLLDDGLKRSLEQVKSQIAEILIAKTDLGKLTEARGSGFIRFLATEIPDQFIPGIPSKLKLAFQMLAEFELSYRAFILYRIRPHLDGLTPKETETLKLTTLPSVQQIFLNLKIAHAECIRNCEKSLKELLTEPNQVAFTIIEEFVDYTIRSVDIDNEWRILLQQSQSDQDDLLTEKQPIQQELIKPIKQDTSKDSIKAEVDAIFALMDL